MIEVHILVVLCLVTVEGGVEVLIFVFTRLLLKAVSSFWYRLRSYVCCEADVGMI